MKTVIVLILFSFFLLQGCDGNGSATTKREYIFWVRMGKISSPWECHHVSSKDGLAAVQHWIGGNQKLLDYPTDLAIIPDKVLYYKEDESVKNEYIILERYPKDSAPLSKRKFVEHIPKTEIERLLSIFQEYGETKEVDKGPYP